MAVSSLLPFLGGESFKGHQQPLWAPTTFSLYKSKSSVCEYGLIYHDHFSRWPPLAWKYHFLILQMKKLKHSKI